MLYLHGSDERGDDNEGQLSGPGPILLAHPENFPFIIVFPQCPAGRFWDKEMIGRAMAALDQTVKEFDGDESRLYLAGFSLGGYGAWTTAAMYPAKFAAIVPMSGRVLPRPGERKNVAPEILELADAENPYAAFAGKLRNTPIWIFHGANDNIVPVDNSRQMAKAFKEVGNENARYTELENTGHVSLNAVFSNPELFEWLAQQQNRNISYQNAPATDDIVYGAVLEAMAYDSDDTFGSVGGFMPLRLKRETIIPGDLAELDSLAELPADLKSDFLEKNKSADKLRDQYDAEINISTVDEKGSVAEIFEKRSKTEKKPFGVIGLSKVGFDKNHSRSLVYVEFFSSENKRITHYCLINWKRDGNGLRTVGHRWPL
jgi:pimeloyl-ACP methyl ester carboxylesterase